MTHEARDVHAVPTGTVPSGKIVEAMHVPGQHESLPHPGRSQSCETHSLLVRHAPPVATVPAKICEHSVG